MEEHGKHMDVEEIKEILTMVSEKIPKLLNSLTDVLYGADQAGKYGKAVAGFYKELKDSGMTDEQAFELTKQYVSSLNLSGMIDKAISGKRKLDFINMEWKRLRKRTSERRLRNLSKKKLKRNSKRNNFISIILFHHFL